MYAHSISCTISIATLALNIVNYSLYEVFPA